MTDWLSEVNEWVSAARVRLAEEVQIPLIDDSGLKMDSLADAFRWGEDGLREAIENVLSRDPGDLAARFVAIAAFYRLMSFRASSSRTWSRTCSVRPESTWNSSFGCAIQPKQIRAKFGGRS